mmetsp:Transcript_18751/g.22156  ORF Transcript_18751/g.22156 Transcript_18751/m.22156 type:complete len:194 (-) Transcript_18751:669-1250(-)
MQRSPLVLLTGRAVCGPTALRLAGTARTLVVDGVIAEALLEDGPMDARDACIVVPIQLVPRLEQLAATTRELDLGEQFLFVQLVHGRHEVQDRLQLLVPASAIAVALSMMLFFAASAHSYVAAQRRAARLTTPYMNSRSSSGLLLRFCTIGYVHRGCHLLRLRLNGCGALNRRSSCQEGQHFIIKVVVFMTSW